MNTIGSGPDGHTAPAFASRSRPTLAVIETGSANLASVLAAFRRAGVEVSTTRDPDVVRSADRVVLPGVGAFGSVMARLAELGVADAVRERVEAGAPFLAICLGMQVLARGSEESPGVPGLGLMEGTVRRFPEMSTVPQLGWNRVSTEAGAALVRDGYAFFANSFYVEAVPEGWSPAWATHDVRFVAAVERGPQLACQFHPELSGAWGASLLERWYTAC